MKLIKPFEISAKILTLLDETINRLIIVSPYMKISKWYKLLNRLNDLKCSGIIPEIYVRDDADNEATYRDLELLELPFKKLPHLHSKLYMNESYGIVTSMNLLLSSEFNSLEIGYVTENQNEYNDLLKYYLRYIRKGETAHHNEIDGQPLADMEEFLQSIRKELSETKTNVWPTFQRNALQISTGRSNYTLTISKGHLRITVSKKVTLGKKQSLEQDYLFIGKKIKDLTAMKINVLPNAADDKIQLTGEALYTLKSTCITGILKDESTYIMDSLRCFIDASENLVI